MNPGAAIARPVFASRSDAVSRARELIPLLREKAGSADANRDVAAETIAAISSAGLFRLLAPKEFGGSQLGLAALVEVGAELASGCGSTGWLYSVLGGHNWLTSLFPVETQREVFDDPDSLVASVVRLGGERPKPCDGGFRVRNAVGKYCSGVAHANWIVLGAGVERADGSVAPTYLLAPKSDVEVVDDWFTVGLRGTGSRTLRVKDAFVPARRALAIADLSRGLSPGARHHDAPLYRAPFPQILSISLAGVPIGVARAGLDAFKEAFRARMEGWPAAQIGEQAGFFMRVAEAGADIDAALALLLKDGRGGQRQRRGRDRPRALDARHFARRVALPPRGQQLVRGRRRQRRLRHARAATRLARHQRRGRAQFVRARARRRNVRPRGARNRTQRFRQDWTLTRRVREKGA